ncbi:MAG TPA: ABC transporter permease subunit [bacterium]|nr:ABC transporter permease subunit [bacterium]
MGKILTIARYTFLEMVRHKVLYAFVFFAFFILLLGVAITQMTIGDEVDIISDIGLGTIEIFATVVVIFMGISIINKEITLRTLHPLLARPISRPQYVLGKFAGMVILAVVGIAFMSLVLWLMLYFYGGAGRMSAYLPAIYTIFLQTTLLVSVAVLCSSFVEPAIGALFTIGFYLIGATSYSLAFILDMNLSDRIKRAVSVMRLILPDFSYFNIKDNIVYGRGLESISLSYATLYAVAGIVIILSLAVLLFDRKELN